MNLANVNWLEVIFKIGTLCIAGWAASSSHKSSKRADASAESSKNSSKVAMDALNLERERFEHEKSEKLRQETDKIISDGIEILKEKGWRTGIKRWFALHPKLRARDDFMDILSRVLGATGNDPGGAANILAEARKEGIIE
jgi:hypothetical protein